MAQITVPRGGSGSGSGGVGKKEFSGPPITISGAGGSFEPVYVSSISPELTGNTDSITDQCGYTEVRRKGNHNWNVSVEGIVESDDCPTLMSMSESDETVSVQTGVLGSRGGQYVIDKCTIEHTDDLNRLEIPMRATSDAAYKFKLTVISPESAKSN